MKDEFLAPTLSSAAPVVWVALSPPDAHGLLSELKPAPVAVGWSPSLAIERNEPPAVLLERRVDH